MTDPLYLIDSPEGWTVEAAPQPDGRWRAYVDIPNGTRYTGAVRQDVGAALRDAYEFYYSNGRLPELSGSLLEACNAIAASHGARL